MQCVNYSILFKIKSIRAIHFIVFLQDKQNFFFYIPFQKYLKVTEIIFKEKIIRSLAYTTFRDGKKPFYFKNTGLGFLRFHALSKSPFFQHFYIFIFKVCFSIQETFTGIFILFSKSMRRWILMEFFHQVSKECRFTCFNMFQHSAPV